MSWREILGGAALQVAPPIPPHPPKPSEGPTFGGTGGIGGRHCGADERAAQASVPDPADLAERAAFLQYDASLSRPEADDQAAREAGFVDAAAYRRQQVSYWRCGLRRLLNGSFPRFDEAYVRNAIRFIDDGWAQKAVALGWDEPSLFWADPLAPWARLDRIGAAYLANHVVAITADTIRTEGSPGSPLTIQRVRGDGRGCVPWERQFFEGDDE